ncbi:3-hydroxy-2-methylbutyryl-CoA dehydrogenase [Devosia sp. Root685]|uniref:SDR family NAD(P)-dependent oxidoreductase n=1 Tax=Devosia sp. Root685 TaxID=1736587 RepID=UPI0006F6C487|nr:SDR family NAD(P)-dependent oxidoreductase [Devosia sp. Root685]KRA95183.1 3-hydroxy-2-methylbutyryl-CoA dehydrogenase [Devosia sp. Root685]
MDIKGKGAVVTGGGSGLGAATARALAAQGALVTVLDRNVDAGAVVAAEIGGTFAACDIADEASAKAALALSAERYGAPAILVNCAGIGGASRIVGREGPMALADFERIIRVNLIGTFNMLRLAAASISVAPPDADGNRGVIISTASVAAFDGQIGQAAYAASKGGITAMTLPAARELARFGIRVVTLAPGLFATPLLLELPEEAQAGLAASIPYPARLGLPADFAKLVLSVIDNDYVNGEVIRIDGALRLPPK